MNYRKLGHSGLKVSEVSLGNWLTHSRTVGDEAAHAIVHRAFELGVNLFDTADAYNAGAAESVLGEAIRPFRRQDLVIATKCYFPLSHRPNDCGLSRKHISESVTGSLARLGTDYIDVMQFHRYDSETPLEETVRAIGDLVRRGQVLYWGVSEWKAHQIAEACAIADAHGVTRPISNQPSYSMLNKTIEDSVLPTSERFGLGQIVFSPLAQGVLTGKYLPGQPPAEGTRAADPSSNQFMGGVMTDEVLTKVQSLKTFAEGKDLTLVQLALAWCLRKPGVSSVIVGASSAEQIEANVAASGIELSDEEWAEAEKILA